MHVPDEAKAGHPIEIFLMEHVRVPAGCGNVPEEVDRPSLGTQPDTATVPAIRGPKSNATKKDQPETCMTYTHQAEVHQTNRTRV